MAPSVVVLGGFALVIGVAKRPGYDPSISDYRNFLASEFKILNNCSVLGESWRCFSGLTELAC